MPRKRLNVKIMDIKQIIDNLGIDGETLSSFFSEDTAPMISAALGIDERLVSAAVKILPVVLSGDFSVKDVVPLLLPTLLSFLAQSRVKSSERDVETNENAPENFGSAEDFSVVDDFLEIDGASDFSPIDDYLQNSSAS